MTAIDKVIILGTLAARTQRKELRLAPGINALAGPNGSGKSTILEAMRRGDVTLTPEAPRRFIGFDTERDNPRMRIRVLDDGFMLQSSRHDASHGESLLPILTRGLRQALDKSPTVFHVVLVDEPETALDPPSLVKVLRAWKNFGTGVQFVVASHHPLVWAAASRILETEDAYVAQSLRTWSTAIRVMQGGKP